MSLVFNSVDGKYNERDLSIEFEKDVPDFTRVEEIVSVNKYLLETPIQSNLYVLHFACWKNAPSTKVLKIINYYPMAAQQKSTSGWYPLHLACQNSQSENIILVLIDINLLAVKAINPYRATPLANDRRNGQSKTIINILETLMEKSDDDLKNCIDIQMTVLRNGFYNRRRHDGFQWLLMNMPTKQIQGLYV
jgi:ankyrin repeat protein